MHLSVDTVQSFPSGTLPSDGTLPQVAILLATFDGARYLNEQLRGYLAQTHDQWCLYWRDDGSSDESASLVEAFAAGQGYGRCRRHTDAGCLRATGSFLALLRLAVAGSAEFFAFSDQDDVWSPHKLSNADAA
jgi:glycosyltransferase involved in cell wall biosynthesis